MKTTALAVAATIGMSASVASAATVTPTSYDMQNGGTGSYQYWDESYNGTGNPLISYTPLSGGTGDLTDGVIATQNWNVVEAPAGPGPYVGWANLNPMISFFFGSVLDFNLITFFFDDSEGAGGVAQPASVTVQGSNHVVPTNPGSAPFSFSVDLTGLTTDQIDVQIFASSSWIFLSEVTFDAGTAAVPLPAGAALLLTALGGLGIASRRRKRVA